MSALSRLRYWLHIIDYPVARIIYTLLFQHRTS
nr:MAG TPA: hypothetical protein [Bacteriophage sp.]